MRAQLERYANRLWYERQRPPWPYQVLARVHERLYGASWARPSARPPVPVVVVGNLTVGGSGKTPVVIALARHLMAAGRQPALLSRGYATPRSAGLRRVRADDDPALSGDEPVLLAAATGLPVWAGRDRARALLAAVAAGADVVLADDGLQHQRLERSFEIVLIDGERGFGNGWLLPAGPLRQPVSRLDTADLVLHRGAPADPSLPGRRFDLVVDALLRLGDAEPVAPKSLAGQPVSALCGIANPAQFARTLEDLGMRPRLHAFPDHHAFSTGDLAGIPRPIVTTAKDAVKLGRLVSGPAAEGILVLQVSAALPADTLHRVTEHVQQFAPS